MKKIFILLTVFVISSCQQGGQGSSEGVSNDYPKRRELERREERGKLFGDKEFSLFGGSSDEQEEQKALSANSYLWKAALDSISFMPIASVDSKSGVIITEWYEAPDAKGERFKLNVLVGNELKSNGVKVSAFKQKMEKNNWRSVAVDEAFSAKIEEKILKRARELKSKNSGN